MNDKQFNLDEGGDLTSLVKKAKRKTILRNTGISLLMSVLIFAAGVIGHAQLLGRSADNALRDIAMFKRISGPNLHGSGYRQNFGFLSGTLEYNTYKVIEGIPVVWGMETYEFNALGNFSRFPGNYSPLQLPDPTMTKEQFDYNRSYNRQTGQREMLFYLPEFDYKKYLNDLPSLDEIGKGKYVEMAISLDNKYTVEQIKAMLPEGVHPVWYWVDTYYNKEFFNPQKVLVDQKMPDKTIKKVERETPPLPDPAHSVYGFGVNPEGGNPTEKTFLADIESGLKVKGKYYDEYKKIYDYLRGEKEKPEENDVKILGVVVTGTPDSLKALNGKGYVKAAVLGTVVDKY